MCEKEVFSLAEMPAFPWSSSTLNAFNTVVKRSLMMLAIKKPIAIIIPDATNFGISAIKVFTRPVIG